MKHRTVTKKGLAGILSAAGLLLLAVPAPPAHAQVMAVAVVTCMSGPATCANSVDVAATTTAVGAVEAQLLTTHTYLTTGATGGPGGMIALLGGINERLGMVTNANDESIENEDLAARQRIYDERMMDTRGSRIPRPSNVRRACVQATAATGRSGAARGSGGAARAAAGEVHERYNDNRSETLALADAGVNRRELSVCSAEDVAEKRPGCQGAGAGQRPSADLKTSTLFDGGKPDAPNVSVDEQGFKIGKQLISNVVPTPPAKPKTDAEKTSQSGIVYMLNYNRYVARSNVASDAMAQVLGFSTAMDVEGASIGREQAEPFLRTWASSQADYEQMFGAGTFPATPSERDLVRFSAFKHYASVQDQQKIASMPPEELARLQFEVSATNTYLNYLLLERMDKQNALLSAMLSQEMDPMTADGMRAMRSAISSPAARQDGP